ncbi:MULTISPECIES: DUF3000 domain-containing protein [Arthrobacter]|uniref:DUF3000 domain-containing protein n=2 Tax=Arthrobacter TaxID=1663 RepID=A0ABU9KG57_9MICC|nr:DUF3000 domain-containing protein [Arthrobacter sp. YJM1]MDP5225882.1 DUF3000 domain-containing protein [Arthrobacter sp. YJM1]
MNANAPLPSGFHRALSSLKSARCRPELRLEEIPAPARLAPFAVALGAEIPAIPGSGIDGLDLATGRFILLHDPAGSAVWRGDFRVVTFIRAQMDAEIGNDELLGGVAWTWLVEALQEHGAEYRAAGGTATRVLSDSFGTLAERGSTIDIELRASWTPADHRVRNHLEAWADMVCSFAGVPALPEGVTSLSGRRR